MRQLLAHIFDDWQAAMGPEATVLAQFADDGRLIIKIYTGGIFNITYNE